MDGQRVYFERSLAEEILRGLKPSFTIETPFASLKIRGWRKGHLHCLRCHDILRDGEICTPTVKDYIDATKMDETSRFVNLCCVPGIYASGLPDGKVELLKTVLSLKYSKKATDRVLRNRKKRCGVHCIHPGLLR